MYSRHNYTPHSHVHNHHDSHYYPHHYYPHHYHRHNSQADNGVSIMLIGILLGSPFLIALGYLQYTTAPMLIAGSSATVLGLSTLAIGSLILYSSIGAAYLISGARQCYNTDQSPFDLLKSRVVDNDFSVKGVVNTLGAILWSPFLFVGGVVGTTAKALSDAFKSAPMSDESSTDEDSDTNLSDSDSATLSSYNKMASEFGGANQTQAPEDAEDEKDEKVVIDGESLRKIYKQQQTQDVQIESIDSNVKLK